MIKNVTYIFLLVVITILSFSPLALAQTELSTLSTISVFTSKSCTHCQDLEEFIDQYRQDYPEVTVKYYHIDEQSSIDLFYQFTGKYQLAKVTPIILIGDHVIEGFGSPATTGQTIIDLLRQNPPANSFENFITQYDKINSRSEGEVCDIDERCDDTNDFKINLPIIGEFNPKQYSMPVLTLILGFLDGFNPCAMWVLIVFISLIVQAGDRRKMWELISIFLIAEAIMYYLILNVWYKTWNFVQLDQIITPIIGIVSIGAGIYFGYEFFVHKGECKLIDPKTKQKTASRIQQIITSPLTIGTFFATIFLAFSVNVIEFACSIGIPQAFTKILDINQYSFLPRQLYMLLYTMMYMIDDIIVFAIALYSIDKLGLTTKYAKYCQLVAAIIMLILGYLLIFNPAALRF
ncbi:glutaredoxin [Patescibacteria group bacterium]|nr:glutaredoxin [Patescibacteria group bacterium]